MPSRLMVRVILEFGRAAHVVHRVVQAHALDRLAVDRGDDVAGLDAGLGGGSVVDRRDHLDEAALLGDLDAQAAELALGLHLHVAERLGVHVAAMRVQAGEHAVDGILHQVLVADRIDVFGAHPLEHVAEQGEQAVGVAAGLVLRQSGGDADMHAEPTGSRKGRGPGQEGGADQQGGPQSAVRTAGTHFHSLFLRTPERGGSTWPGIREAHLFARDRAQKSSGQFLRVAWRTL